MHIPVLLVPRLGSIVSRSLFKLIVRTRNVSRRQQKSTNVMILNEAPGLAFQGCSLEAHDKELSNTTKSSD